MALYPRSLRSILRREKPLTHYENDEDVLTYRSSVWSMSRRVPYGNYLLWRQAARRMLRRYVEERGLPNVIHAHALIYAGVVAVELGQEFRVPVVVTEHSSGFACGIYQAWQVRLATEAAAQADCRIAVSPALGELLHQKLGTRWEWIPNVVASRFYAHEISDAEKRTRPVRLLNLALMTEKKGQEDLLRAFALAAPAIPSTELWLGGDGPLRARLEQISQDLGIYHSVRFLGRVAPDKVPRLIAETDVMVVASHYETFGVVAAEALMMGRPVVATRCGGPECIVTEEDGLLVDARSPDQLGTALVRIVRNLDQYPAASIAERARSRFGGKAVAEQLTAEYQRLERPRQVKRTPA